MQQLWSVTERKRRTAERLIEQGAAQPLPDDCSGEASAHVSLPRILMIGPHRTQTLGGISTMIDGLLRSPVATEFEFRHIVSQADECGRPGKFALAAQALWQFALALLRWRPHLVYVHVGSNASLYRKTIFLLLARGLGQRIVAHFHAGDFDHYYARQPRPGKALIRAGLRCSHQLIAVSRAAEQRLRALLPGAEITLIPNGIRTTDFAVAECRNDRYVRLLFVGAMGRLKGEGDLICALKLASERAPDLRVSLLGHGAETVKNLCHEYGVWSRLEYLGPVQHSDRFRFFRQADIFVLPSYGEGMPLAVLEAMAAGLPIIATRVGGIPDLMTDGAEGFLLNPGDVSALADRIVRLANDPQLRATMGQRAARRVQQFDEQFVLKRLAEELRTAIHFGHQTTF